MLLDDPTVIIEGPTGHLEGHARNFNGLTRLKDGHIAIQFKIF